MRAKIEDGVVYSPFRAADMPCCSFYAAAKEALHDEPDKLALADGSVSLTRRGLFALMRAYGAGFQKYGVKPGDRMCVHLGNSVRNFGAMWGCVFAGASVVLAKTSLTARELHYQLNDSDSTHILTEDTFAEKSLSAASSLQLKTLREGVTNHWLRFSRMVLLQKDSFLLAMPPGERRHARAGDELRRRHHCGRAHHRYGVR